MNLKNHSPYNDRSTPTRWRWRARPLAITLAVVGLPLLASGGPLAIPWFTVDGGGGASTSNDRRFTITGTAGQPDAGLSASNDGQFAVEGGFWSGEIIFCGCALSITYSGGYVTVAWPNALGGCVLEYTDGMGPTVIWHPVSPQPTGLSYTAPVDSMQRYFRLRTP